MNKQRNYDSTVARIAGNILSGTPLGDFIHQPEYYVGQAVMIARMIVAEVASTEPANVAPQETR